MPNVTTNFRVIDNLTDWEIVPLPFAASVAIEEGSAVGTEISGNTTTGNLTLMGVENANGADFQGILQESIATTDDDYATAGKLKSVAIPKSAKARAHFRAVTGTLAATDRFKSVEFSADSKGLAVGTVGSGAVIFSVDTTRNVGTCMFPFPATETA